MIDAHLVLDNTVVSGKGDGLVLGLSDAPNAVFLVTLKITRIVEQEALDVTVYGPADGVTWGAKPLATFPQKFYRGEHPLLLDLSGSGNVKFLRAHWEVARWGRGSEIPMFEFNVSIREVPSEILKEATAEAKTMM